MCCCPPSGGRRRKWQIYYHPHPSETNGVAFLVRNTMDHFVLKDSNQRASLLQTQMGLFSDLLCSFPTSHDYGSSTTMDSKLQPPRRGKMPSLRRTNAMYSPVTSTTPFGATPQVGFGTMTF